MRVLLICSTNWVRFLEGHRVWLRVNPGFGHGHSQNQYRWRNSKHGIWYTDLPAALDVIQRHHLQLVGIPHAHWFWRRLCPSGTGMWCYGASGPRVQSGFTGYFCGRWAFCSYQQGEEAVDTEHYYGLWNAAREQIARHLGHPVKLEIEPGRFLVARRLAY